MTLSTKPTTLPLGLEVALNAALKTPDDEVACLALLVDIGNWAASENIKEIVLPLNTTLNDVFIRRLGVVQRRGLFPESLIITIVATNQAA